LPAKAAAGKTITTVEGIGAVKLHPVQRAFMALDALQCGFCTPGFIVEASAFHDAWRAERGATAPTREEIARALSGHLCRCGAYDNIIRAVTEACSGRHDGETETSPRVEARQKVTGAALYTADVRHEGQLEGLILRSPHAHARVLSVDLAPARATPGVAAAVSLLDEDRMARFVGQPIAAVAAPERKTALAALSAIKVEYETLPSVIGADAARKPGAPILFPRGRGQKITPAKARPRRPAGPAMSGGRPPFSRTRKSRRGAQSPRRGPRAIRCCSRTRSGPESNNTRVSSRMSRSPVSTVLSSPCMSRLRS
jgi:xanthine dehydrogenase YagR molybdenum-binding subunit